MTRLFTLADIQSLLTIDDCIAAVEDVFRRYAEGAVAKSQHLGFRVPDGTFHIKAAVDELFVAKINANFPGNPARYSLPSVQGVIVAMDLEKGKTLAMFESGPITTMRTAAATAVAAKYLARKDARTAGIIGWGLQGKATAEALQRVRDLKEVRAFDSDPSRSTTSSIDEAVDGADIIVTCTPSKRPILLERHFRPGLFIAAVGADNPEKSEIDPRLMARAKVVPDILEQTETMGDLHHAIEAGVMSRHDIHGQLGDIISGRVPARTSPDETFIFDSTGTALQDVAAISLALQRA